MTTITRHRRWYLPVLCLFVGTLACGLNPQAPEPTSTAPPPITNPDPTATPTPTPTPVAGEIASPTPEPASSRCAGLSGSVEMHVVVGPAAAVGMEPAAVGEIPFSVVSAEEPYVVEGGGPINYQDIMTEVWGTYEVTMDLENSIAGVCGGADGSETLEIAVTMSGSQLVEVTAEGFHGEYPWEGEHTQNVVFPLEEGASAEGEGWMLVLHLNQ